MYRMRRIIGPNCSQNAHLGAVVCSCFVFFADTLTFALRILTPQGREEGEGGGEGGGGVARGGEWLTAAALYVGRTLF